MGGGGYEDCVVALIDGEVAECRTRLTSNVPSCVHNSTERTKYETSSSLQQINDVSLHNRNCLPDVYWYISISVCDC